MMKHLIGGLAFAGAVLGQNGSSLPTVDLGYEIYRAAGFNATGNFYNFSNIRYAAPPLGNLRFAPPQAPARNRSAINPGNISRICPQAGPLWSLNASSFLTSIVLGQPLNVTQLYKAPGATSTSYVPPRDPRESEDCLFLDVFVPKNVLSRAGKSGGAAVLVWIYGGGYTSGTKNTNPAGLIGQSGNGTVGDVIYVALNYRLGAFGWSAGPSFEAEGGTPNVGLYDQRFALQWVQNNIHLFGGDKNRVTVFGESAGGGSVVHQVTAYGGTRGKAPFQKAIPQSPGWQPITSNVQKENTYQKFLKLNNVTNLAQLRALPSISLVRSNVQQVGYDSEYGLFTYNPTVDGNFVPQLPGPLLAQGKFDHDVSMMIGHNANEGPYFTQPGLNSDEAIASQLRNLYFNIPQQSLDYILQVLYPSVFDGTYGYRTQFDRANLIVSEGIFTCNTRHLALAFKNQTYNYLFSVPPAFHGLDVAYTYYTGGAVTRNPFDVTNRTVAVALQQFITSFAETGKPAASGVRSFNLYGPQARVMNLNITSIDENRDPTANARCDWWQKALY